jgi:uncharacterized protein YjbI with pentapeptide repeats
MTYEEYYAANVRRSERRRWEKEGLPNFSYQRDGTPMLRMETPSGVIISGEDVRERKEGVSRMNRVGKDGLRYSSVTGEPQISYPSMMGQPIHWQLKSRSGEKISSAKWKSARDCLARTREPLRGTDFSNQNIADVCISGRDLQGVSFKGSTIIDSDLSRVDLSDADLSGARFVNCILSGASFKKARTAGLKLDACTLTGANIKGTSLSTNQLINCKGQPTGRSFNQLESGNDDLDDEDLEEDLEDDKNDDESEDDAPLTSKPEEKPVTPGRLPYENSNLQ